MSKKLIQDILGTSSGLQHNKTEEVQQPGGTSLISTPVTGKFRDSFQRILGAIEAYHIKLGYPITLCNTNDRIAQHRQFCLAIHAEVTELLDAVPWKPWRDPSYKPVDLTNVKEEIVDVIFFLASICEVWGVRSDDLADILERKLIENERRILNGYNKPSDEMKV